LRDDLKREHVARIEDNTGRKGILVENSRRGLEGPDFGRRCEKKPSGKIVRFPSALARRGRGAVKLELQFARIGRVGQLKIHDVSTGRYLRIPDVVPVPGSLPNAHIPQDCIICRLVMHDNSHGDSPFISLYNEWTDAINDLPHADL
jgi:hypothetical protein